jgi:hypothetical protein
LIMNDKNSLWNLCQLRSWWLLTRVNRKYSHSHTNVCSSWSACS